MVTVYGMAEHANKAVTILKAAGYKDSDMSIVNKQMLADSRANDVEVVNPGSASLRVVRRGRARGADRLTRRGVQIFAHAASDKLKAYARPLRSGPRNRTGRNTIQETPALAADVDFF